MRSMGRHRFVYCFCDGEERAKRYDYNLKDGTFSRPAECWTLTNMKDWRNVEISRLEAEVLVPNLPLGKI